MVIQVYSITKPIEPARIKEMAKKFKKAIDPDVDVTADAILTCIDKVKKGALMLAICPPNQSVSALKGLFSAYVCQLVAAKKEDQFEKICGLILVVADEMIRRGRPSHEVKLPGQPGCLCQ